jgi:transcriptional regulator
MYLPTAFAEPDDGRLLDFIEEHGFCTLVTVVEQAPFASHLPVLLDRQRRVLLGHLARANPHWRGFDVGGEALVIFAGPHGYVSPSWYETAPAVPTWNFSAVHVYGRPRAVLEEAWISDVVDRLSRKFEGSASPAWLEAMPADYRRRMLQGVVGVEVPISRIEGKFKLSQNRSAADRQGVIRHLEQRGDDDSLRLAALMRERLGPG